MSIVKVGKNSYRIFVSAGTDPNTGKRIRHTERFAGSFRRAQSREAQIKSDINSGRIIAGNGTTFGDYVEQRWWPLKVGRLSPTTLRGYRSILDLYLLPALASRPLQRIRSEDVTPVISRLVEAAKHRMAKNVHVLAASIFENAVRDEIIGRSPMHRMPPPRAQQKEMRTMTPSQVQAALSVLQNRHSWAYTPIVLLITAGLRRSELCGLRWSDFDANRSILTVRRTYHLLPGGRVVVKSPKTHRSRRAIALDHNTCDLLVAHREAERVRYELFDVGLTDDHYIFSRTDGTPWPPDTYSQLWSRLADELGLDVRLHDLRHTSASLMLAAGVNVKLVSARLGHASTAFTMDTYTHLLDDAQVEAAERLADLLNGRSLATGK